jgi:hypothetical protein
MQQDVAAVGLSTLEKREVRLFREMMYPFVQVGVLGSDEGHNIPRRALTEMARYLGGELVTDLPPFLIACADAFVVVVTVRVHDEYMGGAFCIPNEHLDAMDHGLAHLWRRLEKKETVEQFFKGTEFAKAAPVTLPDVVEKCWSSSFS